MQEKYKRNKRKKKPKGKTDPGSSDPNESAWILGSTLSPLEFLSLLRIIRSLDDVHFRSKYCHSIKFALLSVSPNDSI